MKISDAILAGVGASMLSKDAPASAPQESAAPYPPAQAFAHMGGLGLNTSSHEETTSAAGSNAGQIPPQPTSSSSYVGSLANLPLSSVADVPPASAAWSTASEPAPTPPGSYDGNHAVPTPFSSSSPPVTVRPSFLFPSYSSLWQPASSPAPSNLYPLPQQPDPTQPAPLPNELSTLPKTSLPSYVTTVTLTNGTSTRYHTVFSNCGNGTMIVGTGTESSYSVVPVTATATATVPLWPEAPGSGKVTLTPSPTGGVLTVPCASATQGGQTPSSSSSSGGGGGGGWIVPTSGAGPAPSPSSSQSGGFTQATGTPSPDHEQNSGAAPNNVQRYLFWMAATLVLALVWPC